ncbi:MAG: 50S ribosomal protein L23 [Gammaproteobacteria bacterium]|jgi:large subunit ribosomal protein L23|nr:50S ribosomal protein L23 [Gammaproteobacteria bacterium]
MKEGRLYRIIRAPHVSEKSTRVAEAHNQMVFDVARDATKIEIKQAVEKLFKVEVQSVQVSNVRGKVKRFGSSPGRRSDRRRAYVRLKPGSDIDFLGQA